MNIPGTLQPAALDVPAANLQVSWTTSVLETMLEDRNRIVLLDVILLRADGGMLAPSFLILERYLNQPAV